MGNKQRNIYMLHTLTPIRRSASFAAICSACFLLLPSPVPMTLLLIFASTINVLFRDFHNFSNTAMRFLFFISPVMWQPDGDSKALNLIMKLNPFAYILDGYRDAILYGRDFAANLDAALIFWAITIVMFLVSCVVHMRFRHKFIDLL